MAREMYYVPSYTPDTRHAKTKGRTTPIAESQTRREVSPSRARANLAASDAVLTTLFHPAVAKHRTSRRANVLQAANATAYAQKQKNWPGKKLAARSCDLPAPRVADRVRFRDHRGKWFIGKPLETRGKFLVLRRYFGHKKADHRLAKIIAVSQTSVIDRIPAHINDVASA